MGVEYTVLAPSHKAALDLGKIGHYLFDVAASHTKQVMHEWMDIDPDSDEYDHSCLISPVWPVGPEDIEEAQLKMAVRYEKWKHPDSVEYFEPDVIIEGNSWPWHGIRSWFEDHEDDKMFMFLDGGDQWMIYRCWGYYKGWSEHTIYYRAKEIEKGYVDYDRYEMRRASR